MMHECVHQYINLNGRRKMRSLYLKDIFKVGFSGSAVHTTFLGTSAGSSYLSLVIVLASPFRTRLFSP